MHTKKEEIALSDNQNTCPAIIGEWEEYSGPDGNCPELAPTAGGGVAFRSSQRPGTVVHYDHGEMTALVASAKAGKFDKYLGR